ncbi:alpha/beta hydrolase [Marinomonas piezotolerans]|uniref:Alpha/beta hydrolase n=1 Tax=Marinomonas piezotolerans TaxID=2213058 RepID=A0A370U862_9GAMM|nr:alpha/beta hydrolase [Marinomonas piezotolerans]RDL43928.1 alpha/beta hydrolase [Marinomonas piezotolerans]
MLQTKFLHLPNAEIAYRVVEIPDSKSDKCCVMLHGAGVAGELTYKPIVEFSSLWRWVLIPDLNGMGQSYHEGQLEGPLDIETLANDMDALITHLGWRNFDLVGYSLGGLVALQLNAIRKARGEESHKLALMEPAGLDRACVETLATFRQRYKLASNTIRETGDVELGIAHFMDGVAPNRRKHPVAEATTQSRLAHRPIGFSYALDAVTHFVEEMSEDETIRPALLSAAPEVLLLSGGLSHELLHEHYDVLAQEREGWQHIQITGCDHSLPFQKPRQVARQLEKWFFV